MSGPKVITYSMTAFKGRLKEFMRLQSQLMQVRDELKKATIHDHALNIHYDCSERYEKNRYEIEKALIPMVFDYEGNIDKKIYDSIESQIGIRTDKLNNVLKKNEEILVDFNNRQNDYKSYVEYLSFISNAKNAFEKFKQEVNENTVKNHGKDNFSPVAEAQKKYSSIIVEEKKVAFNWGFDKSADKEKKEIFDYIADKEEEIREIRKGMLDKIIAADTKNTKVTEKKTRQEKPSKEIGRVSGKIKMLINNCNEKTLVNEYIARFEKLKQSESMNDLFFYQELHDSLLENESSRKNKQHINELIASLNTSIIDHSIEKVKAELVQKSICLINKSKVTKQETDSLKLDIDRFFSKNATVKEEAELKKKEQHFIKTQIIYNFEKMGYTVLDDLEVIDFEKEKDFYLQAPGQKNVLNIKFKEDGSFRYVFQIPEKKEALSVDEQKMKLHEMKTTCDDFINVLKDLKEMGVDIDIKSDKPIELESMLTIPESLNNRLNTQKKLTHRKQQIKKLYLG